MKAIMVMFDSLNRRYLPCYGNTWVKAPNFQRLAEHSVVFDNSYIGSMPCMPARRELHTGRYNFLHRSWGPLEPFDDSAPAILGQHGVYTHLVSDHQHYWEDGGGTYHQRYSTWNIVRGQEGDRWKALVGQTTTVNNNLRMQDKVNRQFITTEDEQPPTKPFGEGIDFIDQNHAQDNWFLQLEPFDPHEPFYSMQHYKDLYEDDYEGPDLDWPEYRRVDESEAEIRRYRRNYAALLSMCDRNLGRVLDAMDRYHLWNDTLLIVNTDHGFLLGEHDWWAKCVMPFYNEVAHTPLFIWDPRCRRAGARVDALVQTIDLAPTLLEYFGAPIPPDMQGAPLRETIATGAAVREAGLFGMHGGHVNVTDGRYVYMRGPANPDNAPLDEYTLRPTPRRRLFRVEELRPATLVAPLPFSKGAPVLRIPAREPQNRDLMSQSLGVAAADQHDQVGGQHPLDDPMIEQRMIAHLIHLMRQNDAPPEQFERLGLE